MLPYRKGLDMSQALCHMLASHDRLCVTLIGEIYGLFTEFLELSTDRIVETHLKGLCLIDRQAEEEFSLPWTHLLDLCNLVAAAF